MKTFIALFLLLALSGNTFSSPNDSISRNLGDFHALVVFGNIKVSLKKSDKNSLTLSSNFYDVNKIVSKVENGVLTIKSKAVGDKKEVIVTLFFKYIDNIKVDAGANIVESDTLMTGNLIIKIVKGSLMRGLVKCKNLTVTATQGSEIRLKGTTKNLSVKAGSGGFFDSFGLMAENADVQASMGGKINISVKENIRAVAKTGSVINYKGNPATESVEPSSGGKINKKTGR